MKIPITYIILLYFEQFFRRRCSKFRLFIFFSQTLVLSVLVLLKTNIESLKIGRAYYAPKNLRKHSFADVFQDRCSCKFHRKTPSFTEHLRRLLFNLETFFDQCVLTKILLQYMIPARLFGQSKSYFGIF